MNMKNTLLAGAMLVGSASMYANAGSVDLLRTFDLYDHPGGGISPQDYGLRFDDFGNDNPVTFSFEDGAGNSQVQLFVYDVNGNTRIQIFGTIHGNTANNGTDYGTFTLNVIYEVNDYANGYEDDHGGIDYYAGRMTGLNTTGDSPIGDGVSQDLFAHSNGSDTFSFLSDGHRLDGDNTSWVGRGWITPNGVAGDTNDFLFTAVEVVPLPPAAFAGLLGLSLVGVSHARRRRG